MAPTLIKLAGFGAHEIYSLNCQGGAGADAARINLVEQGAQGDSIIQRVGISCRLGLTTGTPTASAPAPGYHVRWGIIIGNIDSSLPAAINAGQNDNPLGPGFGFGSPLAGGQPAIQGVNRILFAGVAFADVAPPPFYTFPDSPDMPGAMIIPAGQICQLVVLGVLLPQLPTGLTQWSMDVFVNVLGGPLAMRQGRGLPDRINPSFGA